MPTIPKSLSQVRMLNISHRFMKHSSDMSCFTAKRLLGNKRSQEILCFSYLRHSLPQSRCQLPPAHIPHASRRDMYIVTSVELDHCCIWSDQTAAKALPGTLPWGSWCADSSYKDFEAALYLLSVSLKKHDTGSTMQRRLYREMSWGQTINKSSLVLSKHNLNSAWQTIQYVTLKLQFVKQMLHVEE